MLFFHSRRQKRLIQEVWERRRESNKLTTLSISNGLMCWLSMCDIPGDNGGSGEEQGGGVVLKEHGKQNKRMNPADNEPLCLMTRDHGYLWDKTRRSKMSDHFRWSNKSPTYFREMGIKMVGMYGQTGSTKRDRKLKVVLIFVCFLKVMFKTAHIYNLPLFGWLL